MDGRRPPGVEAGGGHSAAELAHALLKEFLRLHGLVETHRAFEGECAARGISSAITKRLQMVDALNLRPAFIAEHRRPKAEGDPGASTLELLILEFLRLSGGARGAQAGAQPSAAPGAAVGAAVAGGPGVDAPAGASAGVSDASVALQRPGSRRLGNGALAGGRENPPASRGVGLKGVFSEAGLGEAEAPQRGQRNQPEHRGSGTRRSGREDRSAEIFTAREAREIADAPAEASAGVSASAPARSLVDVIPAAREAPSARDDDAQAIRKLVTYSSLDGLYPEDDLPEAVEAVEVREASGVAAARPVGRSASHSSARGVSRPYAAAKVSYVSLTSFLESGGGNVAGSTKEEFLKVLFSEKRVVDIPDTWYQSLYNLSMAGDSGGVEGQRGENMDSRITEAKRGPRGPGGLGGLGVSGDSGQGADEAGGAPTDAEDGATGRPRRRLVRIERPGSRGARTGTLGWPMPAGLGKAQGAGSAESARSEPVSRSSVTPAVSLGRPRLPVTPTGLSLDKPKTWGIHQREGGPCGVIASLQAISIKYLIYGKEPPLRVGGDGRGGRAFRQSESCDVYRSAMLSAVFDVLVQFLRNGNGPEVYVVLPGDWDSDSPENTCRSLIRDMEAFCVVPARSEEELREILMSPGVRDLAFRTKRSPFIPCLVASAVLTRGTSRILAEDFDATGETGLSAGSLFVNFNNCSQELVNLLLTGRASASLHDGEMDVGGVVLKGISRPTPVGVLTIFEFYGYLRVGDNAKYNVESPAFVVFNEAHYTCLFAATRGDGEALLSMLHAQAGASDGQGNRGSFRGSSEPARELELVYYDSLDGQTELVRLTVGVAGPLSVGTEKDRASKSFVENILYTLLGGAVRSIDWNGTEPYL